MLAKLTSKGADLLGFQPLIMSTKVLTITI
jgi:hypothetical protein